MTQCGEKCSNGKSPERGSDQAEVGGRAQRRADVALLSAVWRARLTARASPCSPRKEPPGAGRAAPCLLGEMRALALAAPRPQSSDAGNSPHTLSGAHGTGASSGQPHHIPLAGVSVVLCCSTFSPSHLLARLPSTGESSGASPRGPHPRPGFPGLRPSSTGQFPKPRSKCRPVPQRPFPESASRGSWGQAGSTSCRSSQKYIFPTSDRQKDLCST